MYKKPHIYVCGSQNAYTVVY